MDLALVEGFGSKFCYGGTFAWYTKRRPLENEVKVHKQTTGQ